MLSSLVNMYTLHNINKDFHSVAAVSVLSATSLDQIEVNYQRCCLVTLTLSKDSEWLRHLDPARVGDGQEDPVVEPD